MPLRIGYLIPEFPGQTHSFIWRERLHLAKLGVETALVSTRPPPREIISHSWSQEAQSQTAYLAPMSAKDLTVAIIDTVRAGPLAWWRTFRAAIRATGLSLTGRLRLLAMTLAAAKLIRISRRHGWSHVHVHSCADAANIAMLASLLSKRITYSLTLHGPELETYGPNQPQKWRDAKFAIIVSQRLREGVERKLAGFLPPLLITSPMGVDLERLRRQTSYTPWNGAGPVRVFSSGRLNIIKGHTHLIEAVRLLRERGVDVHLRIAGEDEQGGRGYRKQLEQLILDKQLADHVTLLGAIPEEQVRQELESAHVFALASLNEGVSVAIMEAMAMQVPAVATNVGGATELIHDGHDGLLVPPENPSAMANQIERLLRDPQLASRLRQASRQKIASTFHDRRSAEAFLEGLSLSLRPNV
jgi:glycosyltransferase involved in cell wall biosynthesis